MKRRYPCPDVPEGCHCRCHAIGLGKAAQKTTRADAWTKAHDNALKSWAHDGHRVDALAELLTERFGIPRTALAVRRRLRQIDVSIRDGWWSMTDLIPLLGLSKTSLLNAERQGGLPSVEHGRWRRYSVADVERFITQAAGVTIDPRRVRDPRLRALAEVSATANARVGA